MEFNSNQPIYQQIIELICMKIITNVWTPNERIPSVRDLASLIQVNPNTVMRAYSYLEENLIISNKRGIGFFVSQEGNSLARSYLYKQFITIELNRIFNSMDLLGISLNEIEGYYIKFKEDGKGV